MITAKMSRLCFEPEINSGSTAMIILGNGVVPITLSTAIFNGTGTSSVKGVISRSKRKIAKKYGQKGFAWMITRQKRLKSLSLDEDIRTSRHLINRQHFYFTVSIQAGKIKAAAFFDKH